VRLELPQWRGCRGPVSSLCPSKILMSRLGTTTSTERRHPGCTSSPHLVAEAMKLFISDGGPLSSAFGETPKCCFAACLPQRLCLFIRDGLLHEPGNDGAFVL